MCVLVPSVEAYAALPAGLHVFLNVACDGSPPECIRVNKTKGPNSTYDRASPLQHLSFPTNCPPFRFCMETVAFNADQLRTWCDNFAIMKDAVGPETIGNIPFADPRLAQVLERLGRCCPDLRRIRELVHELEIDTPLRLAYRLGQPIRLTAEGQLTQDGEALLEQFVEAVGVYQNLPELRAFVDTPRAQVEPEQWGAKFRYTLQNGRVIGPIGMPNQETLSLVDYAMRPLRINTLTWRQAAGHDGPNDARRDDIDLMLSHQRMAVIAELKMAGDGLTSTAMRQVLYYGSTMIGRWQRRRLLRHYYEHLNNDQVWLAILVENRSGTQFVPDYETTLAFAQSAAATNTLGAFFRGIFFIAFDWQDGDWNITRAERVDWD